MENYYLFPSEKPVKDCSFFHLTEMQVGNSLENYVVAARLGLLFYIFAFS